MFNIKNIVSKITDRGRNSVSSDDYTEQGAEGFLCPKCMAEFKTPEELHNHYESQHKEVDSASVVSSGSFDSVKEDHQIHKMDSTDNISEIFDIIDINVLRDKFIESLKVNTKLKSEKEHLEQVAANLAHANVSLKAASDEAVDSQTAIGERLKIVEAQLAHRESIDDAAVLRQELVQVQRYMDELTREKEREVEELKEKLNNLLEKQQEQTVDIPNETEQWERKLSELTEEKETEYETFQEELRVKKNEINDLIDSLKREKETNEESRGTITKIQALNQTLQEENTELKNNIESIKTKMNEQNKKIDHLIKIEQENVQIAKKLETCKIELNYTKEVLDQEVLKHQTAAKAINLSKNKINVISDHLKSKFIPNDQIQETEKELIINEINDLLKIISPDIQNIEDEIQKQNINLQRELRQAHLKIEESEKVKSEFEKTIQKNKLEISTIEKELKEALEKIQTSEKNLKEYEILNESFKMNLETTKKEKNQEIMDLKKKLSDLLTTKSELESLKIKMKENSAKYNDLCKESKANIDNLKIELDKYKKLEVGLNKENAQLKTEITNLLRELTELRDALAEANKTINIFEEKVRDRDETIHKINEKNTNIMDNLSLKLIEFTEMETKYEELKDNLNSSLKNNTELNQAVLEAKTHNEELSTTIIDLTAQVQDLKVEKTSLDTNIFQLEKLIADLESEKKDAEETHNKQIDKYQDSINNTKKEINDLVETKNIIIQDNAELKTQIISIKEKYEKDNNEFKAQEKSLREVIKQQKSQLSDLEEKIKNEISDKHRVEQTFGEIKKNYELKLEEKNSEVLTLKSSLDEITGNKLELQAQLETCQSEQKTLLERYYVSSFDNEKLHETISDLRRKLEDSQSALHELGRENQTLQLELEKLFGRKWTEDSDVANCYLCRKEFSLINRRHHCRNCGQIFCNDCSSKLAPVSNNKKPVRVCDSCYNELTSI